MNFLPVKALLSRLQSELHLNSYAFQERFFVFFLSSTAQTGGKTEMFYGDAHPHIIYSQNTVHLNKSISKISRNIVPRRLTFIFVYTTSAHYTALFSATNIVSLIASHRCHRHLCRLFSPPLATFVIPPLFSDGFY